MIRQRKHENKVLFKSHVKWNFGILKAEKCLRKGTGQFYCLLHGLRKQQSRALVTQKVTCHLLSIDLTFVLKRLCSRSMTKRDIDLKKSFKTVKWITPLDEDECTIRWCWWKREMFVRWKDFKVKLFRWEITQSWMRGHYHSAVIRISILGGKMLHKKWFNKNICCRFSWSINFRFLLTMKRKSFKFITNWH